MERLLPRLPISSSIMALWQRGLGNSIGLQKDGVGASSSLKVTT